MLQGMRGAIAWVVLAGSIPVADAAEPPLLARIFADHVVLQRDRTIDVYGAAGPRAAVTVTLSGATLSTTADAAGRWRVALPPMPAGGPFTLTARTKDRQQSVADVLVGDVWLCSGQSNMEW